MFCVLLVFVLFMLNMHAFILRLRYSTFGFFLMLFNSLSASLKTLQTPLCGESSVRLEMTKPLPAVLESLKNEWRLSLKRQFCLLSFPEKLAFHRYTVPSDSVNLQLAHQGIVTPNDSYSHQPLSWYDSPLWTSKEITLTHTNINTQHTHIHTQGLNAGQLYLWGQCVLCANNRVPFHLSDGVEIQKSVNAAYSTHIHTQSGTLQTCPAK